MRVLIFLLLSVSALGCGTGRPPPPLDPPVPFGDPPEEPRPSARGIDAGSDPTGCRNQFLEPNKDGRGCIAP